MKKKDQDQAVEVPEAPEPAPPPESASPTPAPPEPTPAPPEPTPVDDASKVIAQIQAEPDYVHQSAEHLEVLAVRHLVEKLGWDLRRAEVAVRSRLF